MWRGVSNIKKQGLLHFSRLLHDPGRSVADRIGVVKIVLRLNRLFIPDESMRIEVISSAGQGAEKSIKPPLCWPGTSIRSRITRIVIGCEVPLADRCGHVTDRP